MNKYIFETRMEVRDYECDLQGIVNNANYQHYLEHARHEFLLSLGVSFAQLHAQGIDAVVSAITMRFKTPLKSGDEFVVKSRYVHDRFKYIFYQDIYRAKDEQLCFRGKIELVCLVNGRLSSSPDYDAAFAKYL